jgi:hypothetical protein
MWRQYSQTETSERNNRASIWEMPHNAYKLQLPFFMAQQPIVDQGLFITEASLSHSNVLHSIWLLWRSDRPATQTSTGQHTTLTTDIHVLSGIRTHNPSKRTATYLRLRQRRHWGSAQIATYCLTSACLVWLRGLYTMRRRTGTSSRNLIAYKSSYVGNITTGFNSELSGAF